MKPETEIIIARIEMPVIALAPETQAAVTAELATIGEPAPVTTPEQYEQAGKAYRATKALGRKVEAARDAAKRPFLEAGRTIDRLAKELAAKVEANAAGWEYHYLAYASKVAEERRKTEAAEAARQAEIARQERQAEQARRQAEVAARDAELAGQPVLPIARPTPQPPPVQRPVVMPPPALPKAATTLESLAFTIPNEDALHVSFLSPDTVKIGDYMREHKAKILELCHQSTDESAVIHGVKFTIKRTVR